MPRSIEAPNTANTNNTSGFRNMFVAAKDARIKSFTFATTSSTYCGHPALPQGEENIGKTLSPNAVTKYVNELYADVFAKTYGFETSGLRCFNIFRNRQDPNDAYAAVIPKWTTKMLKNEDVFINGDGETGRDFCSIENADQASLLSAFAKFQGCHRAAWDRTGLNDLFESIKNALSAHGKYFDRSAVFRGFRTGDVRHPQAGINQPRINLAYHLIIVFWMALLRLCLGTLRN